MINLSPGDRVKKLLYFLANCSEDAYRKEFAIVHKDATELHELTKTLIWAPRNKVDQWCDLESAIKSIVHEL